MFFNDAAGDLIGRRFEDVGRLRRDEWASEFGPFDAFGKLIPPDELATSEALRRGLPAHGRFLVRARDEMVDMDVSALPLTTADGFKGVIVALWPANHAGSAEVE